MLYYDDDGSDDDDDDAEHVHLGNMHYIQLYQYGHIARENRIIDRENV
jgi:hypothetical protein